MNPTVQDAIDRAFEQLHGGLETRGHLMLALNRQYVKNDAKARDSDEIALIAPVSGGAALHTGLPENFQNVLITPEPLDSDPLIHHVTTASSPSASKRQVKVVS